MYNIYSFLTKLPKKMLKYNPLTLGPFLSELTSKL